MLPTARSFKSGCVIIRHRPNCREGSLPIACAPASPVAHESGYCSTRLILLSGFQTWGYVLQGAPPNFFSRVAQIGMRSIKMLRGSKCACILPLSKKVSPSSSWLFEGGVLYQTVYLSEKRVYFTLAAKPRGWKTVVLLFAFAWRGLAGEVSRRHSCCFAGCSLRHSRGPYPFGKRPLGGAVCPVPIP